MSTGSRQHAGHRRALRALACALSGAALALLAAAGCQNEDLDPDTGLNPRPEELPSANAVPDGVASTPEANSPPRETCEDNALLAGCAAPAPSVGGNQQPEDSGDDPIDLNAGGDDAGADPSGLDADAGALSTGDAGTP